MLSPSLRLAQRKENQPQSRRNVHWQRQRRGETKNSSYSQLQAIVYPSGGIRATSPQPDRVSPWCIVASNSLWSATLSLERERLSPLTRVVPSDIARSGGIRRNAHKQAIGGNGCCEPVRADEERSKDQEVCRWPRYQVGDRE